MSVLKVRNISKSIAIFVVFTILLSTFSINVPKIHAAESLIVPNGGFEQVADGNAVGWTATSVSGSVYFVPNTDKKYVRSGDYSIMLYDSTSANVICTSSPVAVNPGSLYEASVYCYTVSASKGNAELYLGFYDSSNKRIGVTTAQSGSIGSWSKIKVMGLAPEGTVCAKLLLVSGGSVTCTAYYDDAAIREVPKGLQNPGFEQVTDGQPDSWTIAGEQGVISVSSEKAYMGSNSLKINDMSNIAGPLARSAPVSVTPGELYETSVECYAVSGTPEVYMEFWDKTSKRIDVLVLGCDQIKKWGKISGRRIAPAGAAYATVLLYSNSTNVGTAYFDEVSFIKLDKDVINGGFEKSLEDNQSWKVNIQDAASTSAQTVTQTVYEGQYSLKLIDDSKTVNVSAVSNRIFVEEGSEYEASIHSSNESGISELALEYYDSNDSLVASYKTTNDTVGEWKNISVKGVVPYNVSYALMRISTSKEGTGVAYFDNAAFKFITDIQIREFPLKESGHPRLFFTSEDIQSIRDKAKDTSISSLGFSGNSIWTNLEKTARGYLTESSFSITYYGGYVVSYQLPPIRPARLPQPPGYTPSDPYPYWTAMSTELQQRIETLSLAYSVTGEVEFANRAKEYCLALASWDVWSAPWCLATGWNTLLDTAHLTMGVSTAYDLLYDILTPEERATLEAAIVSKGLEPLYKDTKIKIDDNIQMLRACALGTGALVLLGKAPDANKYLTRATDFYKWYLDMRMLSGQQEGMLYTSYSMENLMRVIDQLSRTTGQSDLINHPFINDMVVRWILYSLIPGGGGLPNFSDASIGSYFYITMSVAGTWLDNGYAGWYLANAKPTAPNFEKFIYFNPNMKVTKPDKLESSAVFDEIGWASLRTGWEKSDTMLEFISNNSRLSHNHLDQNSFIIATNGSQIANDPGYQDFSPGPARDFTLQYGHNTIFVDGKPQNVKGNGYITKGLISPYYDYVKGSAEGAYALPSLDKFDRHIVNIKPGYYVIMDDLAANTPRKYDWVMYTGGPAEFEVDGAPVTVGQSVYGNSVYVHKGAGQMIAKSLAPGNLPISIQTYPGAEGYGPFIKVENQDPSTQYKFLTVLKTGMHVQKGTIKILDLGSPVDSGGQEVKTVNAAGTAAVFYKGNGPQDYITFKFNVQSAGEYDAGVMFIKSPSYGMVQVYIDGNPVGKVYDGYNADVTAAPKHDLGKIYLTEGDHQIKFVVTDKNQLSNNYYMGIDCISLLPADGNNGPEVEKVTIDADYLQADNVIGAAVKNSDTTDYVLFKTGTAGAYAVSGVASDADQSVVSVGSEGNIGNYAMTRGTTLKYNDRELLTGSAVFSAAIGYNTQTKNMDGVIDASGDMSVGIYTGSPMSVSIDGNSVVGAVYDTLSGLVNFSLSSGTHKISFSISEVPGPVMVVPNPITLDSISQNVGNSLKDLDKKTDEQAVKDVLSLLKDIAGLKEDDRTKVTEKITELVEKTVEKLVKLDEKAMEKTEIAGSVSVQLKQEAIDKVLESLANIENGLKDSKLEGATLKKQVTVELKDVVKEEIKVGIPVESVKTMAEKGLDIAVRSGSVSFNLPAKAIKSEQLAAAEAGTTVQLASKEVKAEDADKFTGLVVKAENEKMNLASKVYDFNLSMVKGENTTKVTEFAQKVTVEVPYSGTANADKLGVYCYNPETKAWDYVGGKVNKETGKVEFKTGHFSVYAVMEYSRTFEDMKDHWAQADVELMASKHIIKGKGGDIFAPESNITRAEFATMIVKALGMDTMKYKGSFKDVEAGSWYSDIVQTAADSGIIQGYEGNFRPEDTITREEMTVIMMRAYKLATGKDAATGDITQFSDKDMISSWAVEAVKAARGLGFINGVNASEFAPGNNATRAESAAIAKRLLDKLQ